MLTLWTSRGTLYALGNLVIPERPQELTATPVFDNAIQLRWKRPSGDASGIVIERKRADEETFSELTSIAAEDSTFVDEGLEPFTAYTYRLRAFHQEQFSDYSEPASAQTVALGDTPWPMRGHDPSLSGKSPLLGPEYPAVKWKYQVTGRDVPPPPIEAVLLGEGEDIYLVISGWGINDPPDLHVLSPEGKLLAHRYLYLASESTNIDQLHSFFVGRDGWIYISATYAEHEVHTRETHKHRKTHRISPGGEEMVAFPYPLPEEHPEDVPDRIEDGAGRIYWVEGSELVVSDPDRAETWRLDVGEELIDPPNWWNTPPHRAGTEELIHPPILGQNQTLYLVSRLEVFYRNPRSDMERSVGYLYSLCAIGEGVVPDTFALHQDEQMLPDTYALYQNVPNPFNDRTTIRFDLQAETHVELCIFNIAGQKIATLSDHVKRAGHYALTWDGRNAQGQTVASGVYLYRMVAGNHQEVKRMVVLR